LLQTFLVRDNFIRNTFANKKFNIDLFHFSLKFLDVYDLFESFSHV
jgi:hypothetical protein